MIVQDNKDDPVKLLVTFPSDTKLGPLIQQLESEYLYIQQIKRHSSDQLLISFDCMADLLEIDFIADFGAINTQVKNSHSFSLEMQKETACYESTSDQESFSDSITDLFNPSVNEIQSQSVQLNSKTCYRRPRLTSFEQQAIMEQNMRKEFDLFDETMETGIENKLDKSDIQDSILKPVEESRINQSKKEENVWDIVMGGVVLTSLLVGGVRALRFFLS